MPLKFIENISCEYIDNSIKKSYKILGGNQHEC